MDLTPVVAEYDAMGTDPMTSFIGAGPAALHEAANVVAAPPPHAIVDLAQVRLLAPVVPPRMRNFSVYEGHIRNAFAAAIEMRSGRLVSRALQRTGLLAPPRGWYRRPAYYKGNHLSVIGPYDDIVAPGYTQRLDYELELAAVIGTSGRDLTEQDGEAHVFGYTLLNDVSARDVLVGELFSGLGPAKGKDFDTGNVLGPWLATREEIPDPQALRGEIRVNGQRRAECSTADMYHSVGAMVAEASRGETLVAGEVFGTGCCTWGAGIELKQFLSAGDLVELTLGPLGTQRNRVVA
ncbi:fumarylacetoacetate hydrolase family protein [Mycolicibacterium sp. CBMA 234]|uniref:fumarylacetoacetate hydrolase family protein n=1 Tax=Mycolicibacterium sp. CBMA 234 TaxID=1918495 RepID=UPI0012DD3C34|nr:fumarylacetoacetate hydrolase family protein [Mycolicibacterium sp. CBMA 234]